MRGGESAVGDARWAGGITCEDPRFRWLGLRCGSESMVRSMKSSTSESDDSAPPDELRERGGSEKLELESLSSSESGGAGEGL